MWAPLVTSNNWLNVYCIYVFRNIEVNFRRSLTSVDHVKKQAVFEHLDNGDRETYQVSQDLYMAKA